MDDNGTESMDTIGGTDTNRDAEENALNAFHGIIDGVLSKNALSSTDYESLGEIVRANPLAIETKLHGIFKKILLQDKSSQDDRNSYEKLMEDILHACIRLRTSQKIVAWILIALDESLKDTEIMGRIVKTNTCILPRHFIDKFSASISNLTNSQVGSVLISLIYHLNSCLIKSTLGNKKQIASMPSRALVIFSEVLRQLATAFLEGVDVFHFTWPLAGKQKFINGLGNMGKVLSTLIKTSKREMKDDDYRITMMNLLKIGECWTTIIKCIKHYASDAVSLTDWDDLFNCIEQIEGFRQFARNGEIEECLNSRKVKEIGILCVTNSFTDLQADNPSNNEIHNSERFWNIFVDEHPRTVHNLNNENIARLAELLIKDVHYSSKMLIKDPIQNDGNLVTALIFEILKKINGAFGESMCTTKSLLEKINTVNWWETEKLQGALKSFQKILTTPNWTNLDDANDINDISEYLKALLNLPLMFCIPDLKTIIFLITLSTNKEIPNNSTITRLCIEILSDISERYNEDLLQYIQPEILIIELSKTQHILSRAIESSLTNSANYEPLKHSLASHDRNTSTIVVECMGKVKSKLKTTKDRKLIIKFEKKLLKKMLSNSNDEPLDINQLKTLTVALKAAVTLKKIDDNIINKIHRTLKTLPGKRKESDDMDDIEFTRAYYELIAMALQYRSNGVTVDNTMIKNIWSLMLNEACADTVPTLIDASDIKILNHILNSLKKNTLNSLEKNQDNVFKNCVTIWNAIAKADMGASREKIRQSSLQELIQSIKASEVYVNNNKLDIIKLFINIVSSKRVMITDKTIDLMLIVVNSFMNDSTVSLAISEYTLYLCSSFLKFRPEVAIDYLPILSRLYLKIIQITVEDARKSCEQEQIQSIIILEVQKLTSAFVKFKKDIGKLSPYIIVDMIEIYYGGGVIPNFMKEPLDDSVSRFLSICDPSAVSLLFRVLSPSMQEIFKNVYNAHIKFYKFTGKV